MMNAGNVHASLGQQNRPASYGVTSHHPQQSAGVHQQQQHQQNTETSVKTKEYYVKVPK